MLRLLLLFGVIVFFFFLFCSDGKLIIPLSIEFVDYVQWQSFLLRCTIALQKQHDETSETAVVPGDDVVLLRGQAEEDNVNALDFHRCSARRRERTFKIYKSIQQPIKGKEIERRRRRRRKDLLTDL